MAISDLKWLDLCGSIVGLTYRGRRYYKSLLGGILSILLLGGVLSIIIIYSAEFIGRVTPKMTFGDTKYSSPPLLNISEKFTFAVMTQYNGENLIRNDAVKIDAILKIKNGTNWTFNQVNPKECKPSNRSDLHMFERLELSKGACFDVSGISLEGSYATDLFQFLQIRLRLCINEPGCLSPKEIIELFDKTKPVASVYFVDTAFQIYNSTRRVIEYYNYYDVNLTYSNIKESTATISQNEMLVYENYLNLGKAVNYSEFMIDTFRDKGALRSESDSTILEFNFMSSNYKSTIRVSYMQLTEFLANVFSLVNILIITTGSIAHYFNHYFFQSDLMNSFYELDPCSNISCNNNKEDIRKKPYSTDSLSKMKTNNFNSILLQKRKDTSTQINTLLKQKGSTILQNKIMSSPLDQSHDIIDDDSNVMNSKDRLKLSNKKKPRKIHQFDHCNVIMMPFVFFFPCLFNSHIKEKRKTFKKINDSMIMYQDLKNLYRKIMEIDLLKYLLLTEDQIALYQIVPKPQYKQSYDNQKEKQFSWLIHHIGFHYLKSKDYVNKVKNFPKYKVLLESKMQNHDIQNKIEQKLLKLINTV